jgi:hypothetical protein
MTAKIIRNGQIGVPRKAQDVELGDRLEFEELTGKMPETPLHAESPFALYRGIGNLEVSSGRWAIVKGLRRLRGE